jgi:hypothetical protein
MQINNIQILPKTDLTRAISLKCLVLSNCVNEATIKKETLGPRWTSVVNLDKYSAVKADVDDAVNSRAIY